MEKAYSLKVFGRVQGVGFRYNTRISAKLQDVRGWVRNCPDGSVEVFCEGEAGKVDSFTSWLEKGPTGARVDFVKKQKTALRGCPSFTIEY